MNEKIDVLTEFGEFTGLTSTLNECHEKGYWHRAVFCLIINDNGNILLQKRSSNKKLWPNKWDVTVGGHVKSGEFGLQALKRECKEELGLDVSHDDIKFLLSSISRYNKNGYVNNHFDEFYLISSNANINEMWLQKTEVSEVKWFTQNELLEKINNNYDGLTEKEVSWSFVKKILDSDFINQILKTD